MRVISGKCRGTHLVAPEGDNTRPTTDRIKETLFNMIAFDIPESNFLDLFSGSGGIGIESLSRGASKAAFVEKDSNALNCIKQNLMKTKLQDYAIIYSEDSLTALQKLSRKGEKFDIIFMDPPYAMEGVANLLQVIVQNNLLSENGYIILERSTNTLVPTIPNLVLWKEKVYKTTTLSFLRKE